MILTKSDTGMGPSVYPASQCPRCPLHRLMSSAVSTLRAFTSPPAARVVREGVHRVPQLGGLEIDAPDVQEPLHHAGLRRVDGALDGHKLSPLLLRTRRLPRAGLALRLEPPPSWPSLRPAPDLAQLALPRSGPATAKAQRVPDSRVDIVEAHDPEQPLHGAQHALQPPVDVPPGSGVRHRLRRLPVGPADRCALRRIRIEYGEIVRYVAAAHGLHRLHVLLAHRLQQRRRATRILPQPEIAAVLAAMREQPVDDALAAVEHRLVRGGPALMVHLDAGDVQLPDEQSERIGVVAADGDERQLTTGAQ
mmetsp:Transcript_10866/g.27953  ORF Transcript_10866/g.27953 Transcript_10866/m.27953 type:complete len:307 (-) Transcript_10866:1380-2300(-)